MLLGLPAVPSVQSLRTHVQDLVDSVDPDLVMRKLLAAFVELEPVWEGAYYIDGHFSPYSGMHPLPKGWNARRRLAEPGQTDVCIHDAAGRALFFVNRPLNDHLSKVLPEVVKEIRTVQSQLRRETGDLYARLARLEARLEKTPAKVPLNQIKDKPMVAIQRTDRRNMVIAIKLTAYNAERLLARKFFRHYRDLRDWLTIFRSLFHLSGSITYRDDTLLVELEAPDRRHIRQALEATIQELNPMESRLFGTGPKLAFVVKS